MTEDRYEASLSVSRSLSRTLSVQLIGAMEFSTIEQTGFAANSRSFKRPKGSFAATWKPRDDFDVSVTLAKRVSQLSFGDFLASVSLNNDNQNGGNNELVPYQSYNVEIEANKTFGPWGSIKLEARKAWFEDFIDWFPLPNGGEARGNIGDADRLHLQANATLNLDPIGFRGARLDVEVIKRFMNVTDPFTGLERPFSYDQEGAFEFPAAPGHGAPASITMTRRPMRGDTRRAANGKALCGAGCLSSTRMYSASRFRPARAICWVRAITSAARSMKASAPMAISASRSIRIAASARSSA